MAIGTLADFIIYNDIIATSMMEKETQKFQAFNENTDGAITLRTAVSRGEFRTTPFFKTLDNAVRRRDPYSVAAVTDKALSQGEYTDVALDRIFGPYGHTLDAFLKSGLDAGSFSFMLGEQMAEQVYKDYLNTSLYAARGALSAADGGSLLHTATAKLTTEDLNEACSKRGDGAQDITLFVMHSKVYHNLVNSQMAANIESVTSQNFMTGKPLSLGRMVFVTDSPALKITGVPDKYYTLGLGRGAISVTTSDPVVTSELETGQENVFQRVRSDYTFKLSLAGMSWDTSAGANPDETAIAVGANWLQAATSTKSLPGVIIESE